MVRTCANIDFCFATAIGAQVAAARCGTAMDKFLGLQWPPAVPDGRRQRLCQRIWAEVVYKNTGEIKILKARCKLVRAISSTLVCSQPFRDFNFTGGFINDLCPDSLTQTLTSPVRLPTRRPRAAANRLRLARDLRGKYTRRSRQQRRCRRLLRLQRTLRL